LEEHIASIIRVEESVEQETSVKAGGFQRTTRRHIPEDLFGTLTAPISI
jgi:hypothetical protein